MLEPAGKENQAAGGRLDADHLLHCLSHPASRVDELENPVVRVVARLANVLFDGGFNKVHDHGDFTWSGVYYVDVGEAGDDPNNGVLEFIDPRGGVAEAMKKVVRIQPAPGGLVLFPGWLKHYVLPYRGSRPRISIAFNVRIVLPGAARA